MVVKCMFDIILMCYFFLLKGVNFLFDWDISNDQYCLLIEVMVKMEGLMGVEMEVLIVVFVCVLIVYDMCKVIDKGMIIGEMYLFEKSGGKNGDYKCMEL